ncbi:GTPase, partial [Candidatus Bathyarchaeota archaeon]
MFIIFVIGTAGSGKSLLTSAFAEWLRLAKQDVAIVSLDPGAVRL